MVCTICHSVKVVAVKIHKAKYKNKCVSGNGSDNFR